MIDATSSLLQGMASGQQQAALTALRLAAESQRQVADMLTRQAVQPATGAALAANPPGVGQNVDTYA